MGISATVHGNKILFIEIQGVSHTNPKYSGLLNLKCTENVRSQFVVLFDYPAAFSAYENAVFGDEYSSCLPLNEKQVISVREKSLREGANKRGNSSRLTQSFHFFMFEPIFSPVNALNQPI